RLRHRLEGRSLQGPSPSFLLRSPRLLPAASLNQSLASVCASTGRLRAGRDPFSKLTFSAANQTDDILAMLCDDQTASGYCDQKHHDQVLVWPQPTVIKQRPERNRGGRYD